MELSSGGMPFNKLFTLMWWLVVSPQFNSIQFNEFHGENKFENFMTAENITKKKSWLVGISGFMVIMLYPYKYVMEKNQEIQRKRLFCLHKNGKKNTSF